MKKYILILLMTLVTISFVGNSYGQEVGDADGGKPKKEKKVKEKKEKEPKQKKEKAPKEKKAKKEKKQKKGKAALMAEIAQLKQEIESYKNSASSLEEERDNLQAEVGSLNEENESLKKEINDLQMLEQKVGESYFEDPTGLAWKVQLGAYEKFNISLYFQTPRKMESETVDGVNKYVVGFFPDFATASDFEKDIERLGIKDAWVVPYNDGKRISDDEAGTILGNKDFRKK